MRMLCAAMFALLLSVPAFADTPVTLRARVEANGPVVTFGDLFTDAGAAQGRAVAPAPSPGQISMLSAEFLVAAAQTAGLAWTPPAGMTQVRVVRPGGARATLASATPAESAAAAGPSLVRRGETIMLVYVAPGMQISTHARAMQDGAMGARVRLMNLQSNRPVDAVVTGPGAAAINLN